MIIGTITLKPKTRKDVCWHSYEQPDKFSSPSLKKSIWANVKNVDEDYDNTGHAKTASISYYIRCVLCCFVESSMWDSHHASLISILRSSIVHFPLQPPPPLFLFFSHSSSSIRAVNYATMGGFLHQFDQIFVHLFLYILKMILLYSSQVPSKSTQHTCFDA